MKTSDMIVRVCGIAGDGIVTFGRILAQVCAEMGLDLMVNDNFSAEIRGLGKSTTTVRFASHRVRSMGDGIDALVALARDESIAELADIQEGGCLLYDVTNAGPDDALETRLTNALPKGVAAHGIPLRRLANLATGTNAGRNLVAMGALCHLLSLPREAFASCIDRQFKRKGRRIVSANQKAFRLGYEYAVENFAVHAELVMEETFSEGGMISGNQALAKGALHAGLHFFAGYPITPATTIMEIVAREIPKLDGWMLQAEDEIAAIAAVVGASFAGKRAMTATSGPGLALMSEMINLAVMAEIPAVIVDVQRGGPATGLPTKVEQGDLNIALYGGSGDSPRVVMAPLTCRECYTGIQLAFDLAEKYQTPVIFLSDLFLGQRIVTTTVEETIDHERCTRVKPETQDLDDYRRFKLTESGISPMIVPGEEGAIYTCTGLEHSEVGNPNYEPEVHRLMTEKRFKKFETMLEDIPAPEIIGDADAVIGFAAWGSPAGAIIEGMEMAREEGVPSKLIRSLMIHPQREDAFREFFDSCDRIIIPEMNFQGQYAALLKARYGIRPIEMHLPGILPVSPRKIADKILEVNRELSDKAAHSGVA